MDHQHTGEDALLAFVNSVNDRHRDGNLYLNEREDLLQHFRCDIVDNATRYGAQNYQS